MNHIPSNPDIVYFDLSQKAKKGFIKSGQYYTNQLAQLMGHLLFEQKQYEKALPYLANYVKSQKQVEYIQGLAIRYLKPPTPPPAGDIIITQEPDVIIKPAPPIIIRQLPVIILMIIIKFRSIIKFKTYVSATTIDTKTFNNPGKTTKSSSNRKQKSNYNIW